MHRKVKNLNGAGGIRCISAFRRSVMIFLGMRELKMIHFSYEIRDLQERFVCTKLADRVRKHLFL